MRSVRRQHARGVNVLDLEDRAKLVRDQYKDNNVEEDGRDLLKRHPPRSVRCIQGDEFHSAS